MELEEALRCRVRLWHLRDRARRARVVSSSLAVKEAERKGGKGEFTQGSWRGAGFAVWWGHAYPSSGLHDQEYDEAVGWLRSSPTAGSSNGHAAHQLPNAGHSLGQGGQDGLQGDLGERSV